MGGEQGIPYGYLNGHSQTHIFPDGADPLSFDNLMPWGNPAVGDILVATTVNGKVVFRPYSISVPGGAGLRNAIVLDNGDTTPTYKATLDATLPVVVTPGGAGAAGTSKIYAHRDHDHPGTDVASAATLSTFMGLEYATGVIANQSLTDSSTTFQNVTNMILPLAANQMWRFAMTLIFISSLAADFKFQFTVPAGATLYFSTSGFLTGGGTPASVYSQGAGAPVVVDGLAANTSLDVAGTVICGGTAGNMQLQAAQDTGTADAGADKVLIGSNIFGRRFV